ncbi:tRNA (guanine(37)-N1)-methyltransferase [Dictyocoela muelleri]|nr:tRNA (guanine(37)-N1)-methyltransferase [Dictyocoela muelleri]
MQDHVFALQVSKEEIGNTISKLSKYILKIPKIPSIIDTNKNYDLFHIENMPEKGYLILLTEKIDGLLINSYKLVINYKIYDFYKYSKQLVPCKLPKSFETVGTIIHLNLSDSQYPYRKEIGKLFLERLISAKTVVNKVENINNVFRNGNWEILAGIVSLTTIHKEMNNKFFIDYESCYWNSRFQSERKLLIDNFKENDIVCDVFCGVGPLAIPAIKKKCVFYGNDLNPKAIECLKINLKLNHIYDLCEFYDKSGVYGKKLVEKLIQSESNSFHEISGKSYHETNQCFSDLKNNLKNNPENKSLFFCDDAMNFIKWINKNVKADHIIMNLPQQSLDYIKFINGHKPSTKIHCYFFCKKKVSVHDFVNEKLNVMIKKNNIKVVRNVSPSKNMFKLTITMKELGFNF